MLTGDLIRVRRKQGELRVVKLDKNARADALELSTLYLGIINENVGRTRKEIDEALREVELEPSQQRLAAGLRKLIEDQCEFDVLSDLDPEQIRREVFSRAALAWQRSDDDIFDRSTILTAVADMFGTTPQLVELSLFADLPDAHVLQHAVELTPEQLVDRYDTAQIQAVLLRAVKVTVAVKCRKADYYRALFRKLKFLRLMPVIHPGADKGYTIEIDGPFSLFDQVTKYGLQLAMMVPVLDTFADKWYLEADVRWGKSRERLTFKAESVSSAASAAAPSSKSKKDISLLPDDIAALVKQFNALGTLWTVNTDPRVLHLPGIGFCVPDLIFEDRATKTQVYFERLGFWSRDAVWKRVDLVDNGLSDKILFAVSERLRVSEAVLGDRDSAALYVYKGSMNVKSILDRLERFARPKEGRLFLSFVSARSNCAQLYVTLVLCVACRRLGPWLCA